MTDPFQIPHREVTAIQAEDGKAQTALAASASFRPWKARRPRSRPPTHFVTNVSSQQANVEAASAGVKVAEANVTAQQATVNRLKTLAAFEEVRAPFDGVISVRNVGVGDLVNADSGTGTSMFGIVKDDVLRVDVNVPQTLAVGIRDGLQAKVHVFELPDRMFSGIVARNAGALQSISRALPVQVDVENENHALKAGIFVNVEIDVPREHPNIQIPAEALIFNQDGLRAASVSGNRIRPEAG